MRRADFKPFDRLVVVSYRLPFQLFRGKVVRNAGGLVSAILALAERNGATRPLDRKIVWVGKTNDTPKELAKVQEQVSTFELVPVHLEERLDDKTDEDLFRILPPQARTIKIGIASSLAKYNLANQQGVVRLIGHLLSGAR